MPNTDTLFQPGHEKVGGRQKGTPNQLTQQMRDIMANIHNRFLGQLEADLHAMSPKNRWDVLSKLAPYHMPTLSKNDNTNTSDGQVTIRVEYTDPIPSTNAQLVQPKVDELPAPDMLNTLASPDLDWLENPVKQAAQ